MKNRQKTLNTFDELPLPTQPRRKLSGRVKCIPEKALQNRELWRSTTETNETQLSSNLLDEVNRRRWTFVVPSDFGVPCDSSDENKYSCDCRGVVHVCARDRHVIRNAEKDADEGDLSSER